VALTTDFSHDDDLLVNFEVSLVDGQCLHPIRSVERLLFAVFDTCPSSRHGDMVKIHLRLGGEEE
jgi:hypothetical protein